VDSSLKDQELPVPAHDPVQKNRRAVQQIGTATAAASTDLIRPAQSCDLR